MIENVLQAVSAPGPEFRGAPFWAWNAKLEPEELRRQIRLFQEMGIGGFFMHARVGLNTPYLSKEWFTCIKACIDEAEKLGLKAWLYDEDRWPSGAAGGLVTKDSRFRQHQLSLQKLTEIPAELPEGTLGVWAGFVDGIQAKKVRVFDVRKDTLKSGETLLVFQNIECPGSSWFNDQTYLDTMNPAAVREFIKVTHEAYRKNIASSFGKTVPGIFTDEPNYQMNGREARPWTDKLPQLFRRKYGYDLVKHLPELYFHVEGQIFSKARLDYYNLATELFVGSFAKLIGEWCDKNQMQFTGHVLEEDDPARQTISVGAAMRFYEYMQQPGIDLLTEYWAIFDTAKQCSSMAHQFDRRWRLSETYGCTGWDFPFMGHKALGDWQFALGINFRCQHLAWYSMAAEAKRDYPASISYQSPWYRDFRMVEEYFARLGAALSEGEEQRDLLVIHPIESTWGVMVVNRDGAATDFQHQEGEDLPKLSNALLAAHLDFDYGDEEVMSRWSKVKNGRLTVNKAAYKTVLIPELRTIRKTTLELLTKFRKAGGSVCYLGAVPRYLDGVPSPAIAKAYKAFTPVTFKNMATKLSKTSRRVSILDDKGKEIPVALYLLRKAADHQTLFLCNYGAPFSSKILESVPVRERTLAWEKVTIRLAAQKTEEIYELDLTSGQLYAINSTFRNGVRTFTTSLPCLGSHLFFASAKRLTALPLPAKPALTGKKITLPAANWQLTLDDYNVLVLDHADGSVDGKAIGRDYVLRLDDRLRTEFLNARARGGAMVQPWLNAGKKKPGKTVDLKLDYRFNCAVVPATPCYFAVERPDLYTFMLNGEKFKPEEKGYWCDLSLRRIALPAKLLKKGGNVLTLSCRYHELLPGLETAYLLGDFGVDADETLRAPVSTLDVGDWGQQGLPNYAGNLVYTNTLELDLPDRKPCRLFFGDWRGVALAVSVNGSAWQRLPWPPFELDVTDLLKNGKNVFSIRVIGHRRNSHGPFYAEKTWPVWTGPDQFKRYVDGPKRKLVPCGLLEAPVLVF